MMYPDIAVVTGKIAVPQEETDKPEEKDFLIDTEDFYDLLMEQQEQM